MALGRDDGRSSEDHLVNHKFAVVFADRTGGFSEAGIGQIRRICPFPAFTPVELFVRRFPFELGRQSHTFPLGECGGLVI